MADRLVLALSSSPRIGGFSDQLLDAYCDGLCGGGFAVTKHHLSRLRIAPCDNCGGCLETGVCVIRDDMDLIYRGLADAAVLVVASPVYFLNVTAQAKIVIDRCQALWAAKYKLGRPVRAAARPGVFIATAGRKGDDVFSCPQKTIKAFFAAASFRLADSVLVDNLDEMEHPDPGRVPLDDCRRRGRIMKTTLEEAAST